MSPETVIALVEIVIGFWFIGALEVEHRMWRRDER